jgi:hypothetical protein
MNPKSRDRNLGRVRGLTGAAAGIALAACGLFAGLAASATKHVFSSASTTTQTVSPKRTAQSHSTSTTQASPPTVTVTQSAPVATSGGS